MPLETAWATPPPTMSTVICGSCGCPVPGDVPCPNCGSGVLVQGDNETLADLQRVEELQKQFGTARAVEIFAEEKRKKNRDEGAL